MKIKFFSLLLLFSTINCFSQPFQKHVIEYKSKHYSIDFDEYGDLDNNGTLDKVIISTGFSNQSSTYISIFYDYFTTKNNDDEYKIEKNGTGGISKIVIHDYNNDNYKDIILTDQTNLIFYKNNKNKTFSIDYTFLTNTNSIINNIHLIDKNNDGLQDIFVFGKYSEFILNNGDGTFRNSLVKYTPDYSPTQRLKTIDYNNDGKKDIAVFSQYHEYQVSTIPHLNTIFQNSSDTFLVINFNTSNEIRDLEDYDNDGDIDNLRRGFHNVILGTNVNNVYKYDTLSYRGFNGNENPFIHFGKVDNDSLVDVIYSTYSSVNDSNVNHFDSLFYVKNLGNGQYQKILIDVAINNVFGTKKILKENNRTFIECKFMLVDNSVNSVSSVYYEVVNNTTFKKWHDGLNQNDVRFVDINNDNLIDIIFLNGYSLFSDINGGTEGFLYCKINRGNLEFEKPQIVLDTAFNYRMDALLPEYYFFDVNNDNFKDLIVVSIPNPTTQFGKSKVNVLTFLNNKKNRFIYSRTQLIDSLDKGNNSVVSFHQLNNNNNVEILFTNFGSSPRNFFHSLDRNGNVSNRYILPIQNSSNPNYYTYLSYDFDKDGFKDIISSYYRYTVPQNIRWYKNNKNNTFTEIYFNNYDTIPYSNPYFDQIVYCSDINNDNKVDFLFNFGYLKKSSTVDSFKIKRYGIPFVEFQSAYNYIDYDNDRNIDIVKRYPYRKEWTVDGVYIKDGIWLYPNQGNFVFNDSNLILIDTAKYLGTTIGIYNVDLDNDGDIDILSFDKYRSNYDYVNSFLDNEQYFPKDENYKIKPTYLCVYENKTTNRITNVSLYNKKNNSVKIFPNPTSNYLNIEWKLDNQYLNKDINVNIRDVTGKEINKYSIVNNDLNNMFTIPVNSYSKGMYLISLEVESDIIHTEKFVIQ